MPNAPKQIKFLWCKVLYLFEIDLTVKFSFLETNVYQIFWSSLGSFKFCVCVSVELCLSRVHPRSAFSSPWGKKKKKKKKAQRTAERNLFYRCCLSRSPKRGGAGGFLSLPPRPLFIPPWLLCLPLYLCVTLLSRSHLPRLRFFPLSDTSRPSDCCALINTLLLIDSLHCRGVKVKMC